MSWISEINMPYQSTDHPSNSDIYTPQLPNLLSPIELAKTIFELHTNPSEYLFQSNKAGSTYYTPDTSLVKPAPFSRYLSLSKHNNNVTLLTEGTPPLIKPLLHLSITSAKVEPPS